MRVSRQVKVLAGVLGTIALFTAWTTTTQPRLGPHSSLELWLMKSVGDSLTVQYSTWFASAGRCAGCHGRDPNGIASVDVDGVDVNLVDDWRSTMMANSARDPFFRAKLEHEVLVNPGHQGTIESQCLSCHAPLAKHEADLLGHPPFTAAMLDTSVMGQDGVSCLACHGQNPDSAGTLFTGRSRFDSLQVYGPYPDDEINAAIMEFFVGFTPQQGQHIQDGRVCSTCHTLITSTLDLNGNPSGDEFVEQATWHEWKNSIYNGTQNCRQCHMPRIQDSIILASDYPFLPSHSPFGLHHLAGGNVYMLQLMKEYRLVLGIPANDTQFDSTIARTLNNLQQRSVELDLSFTDRTADTAFVDARLLNLTGHKFPSGYPSRRAFVELTLLDSNGDTLFSSGGFDGAYEVDGHDTDYEPHHDVITAGDQAQIYELVMGDVNDDVTTVLERAKSPLKDNRITPQGFSTTHYTYDTCMIAGVPASDIDFNLDGLGSEGTGADIVHYHVPLQGYTGAITAHARVWYQPVPPRWNAEMFSNNGARIDSFRVMVQNMDGTPTLVAHDSSDIGPLGMDELPVDAVRVSPNPTGDGAITLTGRGIDNVQVYTIAGQVVAATITRGNGAWRIMLPVARGTYLLVVRHNGSDELHRVVRQ